MRLIHFVISISQKRMVRDRLHNALKLKKTYSFTVCSTCCWWLFKVSCGFQSYPK